MTGFSDQPRITAVLGPTNTGKTHFAIERLVAHDSGMMGFPLRLLARENYDRVCKLKGSNLTALITGEERIVPPGARYFLCTTESMPVERALAFVALDEVQLCADPDRGHIFTDRLLHCRGLAETMLLGADTMTGIIRALVPEAEIIGRPRFSTLTHTGATKITRLPRRSAAVAFSINDVYALAELVRRHRGGTAVVLGALSPRTRNAQVAMYQAGEVDYLVATDAIGMGLNMDVQHVAFAELGKFDGRSRRRLYHHELAQIAGRAGRHATDGTFGTTANAPPLDEAQIEAIEQHRFDPVKQIFWRNPELDFRAVDRLLASLDRSPETAQLVRTRDAEDHLALKALVRDEELRALAATPDDVSRLWAVCQIPDFRKLMSDAHLRLLAQIFRHLQTRGGRLPHDWVAEHIARLDRVDGDIDALMARIAHVRTWTFISHRARWLDDHLHWQERSRALEDRLSDALHDRLTQRFVDKRSASLLRSLQSGGPLVGAVRQNGEVIVEGEFVGELKGFRFIEDSEASSEAAPAIQTAARRALADEIQRRVQACCNDADAMFDLAADGYIGWRQAPVARLVPGDHALRPRIDLLPSELLDGSQRDRLQQRLEKFIKTHIETILGPLLACENLEAGGPARGIAFQLFEGLGSQPRHKLDTLINGLERDDRRALHKAGIRLGPLHVFLPLMGKTHAVNLRGLLWTLHSNRNLPAPTPANGRTSTHPAEGVSHDFYTMIGYPVIGPLAIRLEILDRVISRLHDSAKDGIATMDHAWAEMLGCSLDDLKAVLKALGYRELPPEEPSATDEAPATEDAVTEDIVTGETPAEPVTEPVAEPAAALPLAGEPLPEATGQPPVETVSVEETPAAEAADEAPAPEQPVEQSGEQQSEQAAASAEQTEPTKVTPPPVRFRLTRPRLGGEPRRHRHHQTPHHGGPRQDGANADSTDHDAPQGRKHGRGRHQGPRQEQGQGQGHRQGPDRDQDRAAGKSLGGKRRDNDHRDNRQRDERPRHKSGPKPDRKRGGFSGGHGYTSDDRPMTHSPFEKLRALQQASTEKDGGPSGE